MVDVKKVKILLVVMLVVVVAVTPVVSAGLVRWGSRNYWVMDYAGLNNTLVFSDNGYDGWYF